MKVVLVILAVLLGAVLIFEIETGSLTTMQVAGAGIICAALAQVVP